MDVLRASSESARVVERLGAPVAQDGEFFVADAANFSRIT